MNNNQKEAREAFDKLYEITNRVYMSSEEKQRKFFSPKCKEQRETLLKSPEIAVDLINSINIPWPELEALIKTNPKLAARYAIGVRKRWHEAEPYILKGKPNNIYNYFYHLFVKDRHAHNEREVWPEAEQIFATKFSLISNYVSLTKQKSELFEKKILENPDYKFCPKYVFEYAKNILKTRWIEAEHIIFKHSGHAAKYCTKFNLPMPEELHNQIISEIAFSSKNVGVQHKKEYLEKIEKTKNIVKKYIKELIQRKQITEKTTAAEIINL